jgi:hypothetical protein
MVGAGYRDVTLATQAYDLVIARIVNVGEEVDDTYELCSRAASASRAECYIGATQAGVQFMVIVQRDKDGNAIGDIRRTELTGDLLFKHCDNHPQSSHPADFRGCTPRTRLIAYDYSRLPTWIPCGEGCCSSGNRDHDKDDREKGSHDKNDRGLTSALGAASLTGMSMRPRETFTALRATSR